MNIPTHGFRGIPVPILGTLSPDGTLTQRVTCGHFAYMLGIPRYKLRETINANAETLEGTLFEVTAWDDISLFQPVYALSLPGVLTILDLVGSSDGSPLTQSRVAEVRKWVETLPEHLLEVATITDVFAGSMVMEGMVWSEAREFAEGFLSRSSGLPSSRSLHYILKA